MNEYKDTERSFQITMKRNNVWNSSTLGRFSKGFQRPTTTERESSFCYMKMRESNLGLKKKVAGVRAGVRLVDRWGVGVDD